MEQSPAPDLSEGEAYGMTELFIVALCLFREARSEGVTGMYRVHDVIANRASDPGDRWPKSRMGVALQPKQFSCFNSSDSQNAIYPAIKNEADWIAWIQAMRIAKRGVVQHPLINHYHTEAVKPNWARGKFPILKEGRHVFYSF
jgi:spore germination cell wall hydrolase CwlJ-like protein